MVVPRKRCWPNFGVRVKRRSQRLSSRTRPRECRPRSSTDGLGTSSHSSASCFRCMRCSGPRLPRCGDSNCSGNGVGCHSARTNRNHRGARTLHRHRRRRHGRSCALQPLVGARHDGRVAHSRLRLGGIRWTEADADDSGVAQLGRCRCRGAPGSTQHHVGERRILVTDRRVPVHPASPGAALDPDHKHRVGSQRACLNDDAASAVSADAVGALVQRTRLQAPAPRSAAGSSLRAGRPTAASRG